MTYYPPKNSRFDLMPLCKSKLLQRIQRGELSPAPTLGEIYAIRQLIAEGKIPTEQINHVNRAIDLFHIPD
ncbi:hypothetical protein NIES4101_73990 [Calothrix sp. NIES-4101]|nr:hypothetical protein NIES4101_73990 [Calothrix sp. NIES-4101]